MHPEQAKRERRIHGRLRLLPVHSEHGQGAAAFSQYTARVHRRETVLQVHGRGEPAFFQLPVRHGAAQGAFQKARMAAPGRFPRRRRPAVALTADFQLHRTRLGKAPDGQGQQSVPGFGLDHLPHQVALFRP